MQNGFGRSGRTHHYPTNLSQAKLSLIVITFPFCQPETIIWFITLPERVLTKWIRISLADFLLFRMRNLSRSLRTSNRLMFFEGRGSKRSETTQSGIKILDKFIFQGAHTDFKRCFSGEAIFHFFWPEPPEKRDPSSFVRAAVQFSSPEDVILPPGGRCIHQEGFRARWKTI